MDGKTIVGGGGSTTSSMKSNGSPRTPGAVAVGGPLLVSKPSGTRDPDSEGTFKIEGIWMLGGARYDGVSRTPSSGQPTTNNTTNSNSNNIFISGTSTATATATATFLPKDYTQAAAPSERITLAIPVVTTAVGVGLTAGAGMGMGVGSNESKPGIATGLNPYHTFYQHPTIALLSTRHSKSSNMYQPHTYRQLSPRTNNSYEHNTVITTTD